MQNPQKSVGFWFGITFIALGLLPMVLMFFSSEGLKVPLLIAEVGTSALVFAGLSFVAQSQGRPVYARIFSACVVLVLAFVGLYFLFGG